MTLEQHLMAHLYDAFNKREIEKVLSFMQPDVKWANGMQGGFVYGRDAVLEYWSKQFEVIQPRLEPLEFEHDENNRNVVTVHQIVHDSAGNLIMDKTVRHVFTIENSLISVFEIDDSHMLSL